ncbi:hypothetical protein SLE2022_245970 [Rubroshorea leprosula]
MASLLNLLSSLNLEEQPSLAMAFSFPPGDRVERNLLNAAFKGNLPRFKRLLKQLDVKDGLAETISSIRDEHGRNCFHAAAAGGGIDVCKYLLEDVKLDIECTSLNLGQTPLHYAIKFNCYRSAAYLLQNGANPNATPSDGFTPLHIAAANVAGSKKLTKLLISKGANPNAVGDFETPLMIAASHGNKDCLEVLLDNHADPNFISCLGFSPLTTSIVVESIECVKLLLKAGADPNLKGPMKVSPLGCAAVKGLPEIIKCLLTAGADPNDNDTLSGILPVEEAALNHNHEAVMILLPVTTPIPTVSHWSYAGILRHLHSEESQEERRKPMNKDLLFSKSKGEELMNAKDYCGAIYPYTKVIDAYPDDADALSNRSFCWAQLGTGDEALEDALSCIRLRPNWPKAYYRAGVAWMLLKDFKKAADAFYDGWKLDLEDNELEYSFWDAIKALRLQG